MNSHKFIKSRCYVALSLSAFVLFATPSFGQDGVLIDYVGTTRDNSAVLDVRSEDQGVLVPRVDITDLNASAPVSNPAEGLLVWNTNSTTGEGFHVWNGTRWARILTSEAADAYPLDEVLQAGNSAGTSDIDMNNRSILNTNLVSGRNVNSYDKIRVWNSSSYTIGMTNAQSFGFLNDYAMTFTMNTDNDRGFLWRDVSDAASDGAMSLTTDGRLTLKSTARLQSLAGTGTRSIYATANGDLTDTGPTSGADGYWSRNATDGVLSPNTANDRIHFVGAGTIGGADVDDAWLKLGTGSTGLGMDNNEVYFQGIEGNFGTIGNFNLRVNTNGTNRILIEGDGDVIVTDLAGSGTRSVSATSTGELTTIQPTSGTSGFWTKSGNTLSPADAADNIDMNGENITDFHQLISTDIAQPKLVLNSISSGDNWTSQGAYISIGESGDLGAAALHMTYRGDGYGWIGSGAVTNAEPGASYFRFDSNADDIYTPDRLRIDNNLRVDQAAVFNEDGGNYDFRVESDGNTNMILLDASTDRVGIGTGSPVHTLHVNGSIYMPNGQSLWVNGSSDASTNRFRFHHSGTSAYLDYASGSLFFRSGTTTRVTMTNAGNVGIGTTNPNAKLDVHGDFHIDAVKPILIRRYGSNLAGFSNDNPRYNTGISDVTYSCVLGGFYGWDGSDIEGVRAYMYRESGTWRIALDLISVNEDGWRNVDCVCYKREMVDDNR